METLMTSGVLVPAEMWAPPAAAASALLLGGVAVPTWRPLLRRKPPLTSSRPGGCPAPGAAPATGCPTSGIACAPGATVLGVIPASVAGTAATCHLCGAPPSSRAVREVLRSAAWAPSRMDA
jgi:hypothetical protein